MAVLSFCMVNTVGLSGEWVHTFAELAGFVGTKSVVDFLKGEFLLLLLRSRNRVVWSKIKKKILVYAAIDNKVVYGIGKRFKSIRVPPITDREHKVNLLVILDIVRSRRQVLLLQDRSELSLNQRKILAKPPVYKRTDSIGIFNIVVLYLSLVAARLGNDAKLRFNVINNLCTHDIDMICVLFLAAAMNSLASHYIASLL